MTRDNRSVFERQTDLPEEPLHRQIAAESLQHNSSKAYTESDGLHDGSNTFSQQIINEHGQTQNFDADPDLERRKRRKTTPFGGSETTSSQASVKGPLDGGELWPAQLVATANSGSQDVQGKRDRKAETVLFSPTPPIVSPVKLAIRKSPIKTPRKLQLAADAPARTPPGALRPSTRSSSSDSRRAPSPGLSPIPKKKLIKLTSKGKLLSSPPSVSAASKRKTRSKSTKFSATSASEPQKPILLSYGTDDESKKRIGSQIDAILSRSVNSTSYNPTKLTEPPKITHPFFLGKPAKKAKPDVIVLDDDSTTGQISDADEKLESGDIKSKDWKDLGFKKNRTSTAKLVDAIRTLWPPKDMQHLGVSTVLPTLNHTYQISTIRRRSSKSRMEVFRVSDDQDILQRFAATLQDQRGQLRDAFPLPQKMLLSGQEVRDTFQRNMLLGPGPSPGPGALQDAYPQAFERMQCRLQSTSSSSNVGVPSIAQSWLANSAPRQTSHVLQSQSNVLRQWLAGHQVHHTATKLSAVQRAKTTRKRRRKKKADELDDFIVTSDEDEESASGTKNAIFITGPSGCGKTASVYAVAKELDFEVFEIHPGMRRSAKDIFDKVGDMTQNHLVHKAAQLDRVRDPTPDTAVVGNPSVENVQGSKNALKTFLDGNKSTTNEEITIQSLPGSPKDELDSKLHSRKQSLILFEEVDILFEEDRGFWSGVIQLIEQSKRPTILTCNDPTSIPVADLPLHATLEYEQVPVNVAVDYILLLAATEGHWLQREAIRLLYVTKQMDLRATISELNFWCQMAVGSEKAGLDWSTEPRSSKEAVKPTGEELYLFSKDTYTSGMGLVPRTLFDPTSSKHGALLQYAEDELGIPLQYWHNGKEKCEYYDTTAPQSSDNSTIAILEQHLNLSEAKSTLDLLHKHVDACSDVENMQQEPISAELAASTLSLFTPHAPSLSVAEIIHAHFRAKAAISEPLSNILPPAFEPLMAEKAQFPPSLGRLAPSLETISAALFADIAPYVRSIVRYDQRLEEQRNALAGGLQGIKIRKTRAARAALEGGSKASTREEKWFPNRTNYAAMLQTGGAWPLWADKATGTSSDESPEGSESRTESAAPSPATDLEMIDDA